MEDSTRDLFKTEAEYDRLLIDSSRSITNWMQTCPVARTYEGWSETLSAWVVIAVCCRRWSCPICGRKKVSHYAKRVAEAHPNKLITLTVNPAKHADPRAAYDATRRQISPLAVKLRRRFGEFEFFRILEATKKGWPHYHLITRSEYIPQHEISNLWNELTGAPIVDVRKMDKSTKAYWYVVKYLGKQQHVPWTDRRAAWSRGFFPKTEFEPGEKLFILRPYFANAHPADHVRWCYPGATLIRYSDNCWIKTGDAAK